LAFLASAAARTDGRIDGRSAVDPAIPQDALAAKPSAGELPGPQRRCDLDLPGGLATLAPDMQLVT